MIEPLRDGIATAIVIVTSLALWNITTKYLANSDLEMAAKRRRVVALRNMIVTITIMVLFSIWANEIKTFALSLVAIAVALVVATKEFILSLLASLMNVGNASIKVGDVVEIEGLNGRVIDITPMSFRLMEMKAPIGYTGREVSLPSSMLVTATIKKTIEIGGFVAMTIEMPTTSDLWQSDESLLMAAATEICSPFMAVAEELWKDYHDHESIDGFKARPKTSVSLFYEKQDQYMKIYLRVAVPATRALKTEQAIIRLFIEKKYGKLREVL